MPHQSDSIVMQLRSAIMLDEKDLLGPLPPSACSSLDDGPFCVRLGLGGAAAKESADRAQSAEGAKGTAAPSFLSLADLQGSGSAQYVVDGVLSNWMQAQNKEAFDWTPDTLRTFSNLVSRVISDSLGSAQDITRQAGATGRAAPTARTGSQCFRLAFDRLLPGRPHVPSNFTAGLPEAVAASWDGVWEAQAVDVGRRARSSAPSWRRSRERRAALEAAPQPPWATQVVLRTALGYIRFAQPLVVRRLLVGVPPASAAGELWGRGSLVCGRLKGREQWCAALDQAAASARSKAAAEEDHAGSQPEGYRWVDLGNSIHAVDEVAFVAAPATGLAVGLVEVVATLPSHPLHGLPAQRRVVLLRPSRGKELGNVVEPTLAVVSRDAAIWDMNEVVRHHMLLRTPGAPGRHAAGSSTPARPVQKELQSFQEMLQGLKAGKISPPPGVTLARLKREVASLVASTKKIQDDDVLLHSKIESLLQQRLRELGLDGLLALQAAWRNRAPSAASGPAARAAPGASAAAEAGAAPAASAAEARAGAAVPTAEGVSRRWADDAAEAMEHASAELERKAAEVRGKAKKQKAGGIDFQMDLERGTIELRLGQGGMSTLQGELPDAAARSAMSGDELAAKMSELVNAALTKAAASAQPAGAGAEAQEELPAAGAGTAVDEDELPATSARPAAAADDLAEVVAAALKQAGVGGAGSDVQVAGGEAMQEALRRAMAQNQQVDSEGNPMKMQVHFVKLEDLASGESEGEGGAAMAARMLQTLLNQQGGGAGALSASTLTPGELQNLLRAQQQANGGEGDGGEGEAEVPVEAGDVVGL